MKKKQCSNSQLLAGAAMLDITPKAGTQSDFMREHWF